MIRPLLVLAATIVAGCALLEPPAPTAPVDQVIAEALQTARAPAGEQRAALKRAEKKFIADPAPINRLRLAPLLATLAEPIRDDARAAELLDTIADASDPGIGRFASLLAAQIAERRRLAREAERLARERDRTDKERDKRE